MLKEIPLTEEEIYRRRHEVLATSMHLFVQKVFLETTMQEIAISAEMGKSTFY
jgi:AcrR family transcriptional regulator